MEFVGRTHFELGYEVQGEVARFGRLRVNEQSSTADLLVEREQPRDDIDEERRTKSTTLVLSRDAESSEQRDGCGYRPAPFRNRGGASGTVSWARHHA